MTTLTRLLAVTYGSRTITGPSDLIRFHDGWETGELTFRFVVRAANMGALATACDSVIQDFRIPHQRLQLKFNGTAELDWNPAVGANTAFQVIPTIAKHGDPWDSGTAQTLEATIHCSKPADKDSRAGRRFADVDVTYTPSRRRSLTINGLYTAITSNDATAQYAAQAATYAASIRTGLGGTWEQVAENYSRDDIDKELRFTLSYRELIYDHPVTGIIDQHTFISVSKPQQGNSPTPNDGRAAPLAIVNVKYDASIDKTVTQDLESVYLALVPWLAARVGSATSAAGVALINDNKTLDYDENRISLDQTWQALLTTDYIEYQRTEKLKYSTGKVVTPVWSSERFARYEFDGPEALTIDVEETYLIAGSRTNVPQLDPVQPFTSPPDGAKWVYIARTDAPQDQVRGVPGYDFPVVQVDRTSSFEASHRIVPVTITPG